MNLLNRVITYVCKVSSINKDIHTQVHLKVGINERRDELVNTCTVVCGDVKAIVLKKNSSCTHPFQENHMRLCTGRFLAVN